jgi:hypothetical protein
MFSDAPWEAEFNGRKQNRTKVREVAVKSLRVSRSASTKKAFNGSNIWERRCESVAARSL